MIRLAEDPADWMARGSRPAADGRGVGRCLRFVRYREDAQGLGPKAHPRWRFDLGWDGEVQWEPIGDGSFRHSSRGENLSAGGGDGAVGRGSTARR